VQSTSEISFSFYPPATSLGDKISQVSDTLTVSTLAGH